MNRTKNLLSSEKMVADVEATRLSAPTHPTRLAMDQTRLSDEGHQSILATRIPEAQEDHPQESYRIGDIIDEQYEVLAIHRGSMGVVYGVFDYTRKLPLALKTLQVRFALDAAMRRLFSEEATVWVKLESHPFIIRAYFVDRFDSQPYVITDYIRGQEGMGADLRAWLGHPRLTLSVAVEMALQMAQGMQHAVAKLPGLVHRDLKPANVLVDAQGRPRITDFGLVGAMEGDAGTPAYMAPEQWQRDKLTSLTDIYAYGCILYEMFTGHRMYPAVTVEEWRDAHLERLPINPCQLNPDLPEELGVFVLRCLSKTPHDRPRQWDEVVNILSAWFHQLTGQPAVLDFSSYSLTAGDLVNVTASLCQLKKNKNALETINRAIEIDPGIAIAWGNKGLVLSRLGRFEEAFSACKCAIEIDPNNDLAWIVKGMALSDFGRHTEALAACERAIEIDPNNAIVWELKGQVLGDLDRNEEALAVYEKAIEIDPNNDRVWEIKGSILEDLDRNEEALTAYEKAIEIDPTNVRALTNKGVALTNLGHYKEALFAGEQAIEIDPNYVNAWNLKGTALYYLDRNEEALVACEKVIEIDPANVTALMNKGAALTNLDCHQEALFVCEKVIEIEPNNVRALTNKGAALTNLGRYDEARTVYERSLEIDPDYKDAKQGLRRVKEYLSTIATPAGRLIEKNIDNAEGLVLEGKDLFQRGQTQEAIWAYERAITFDPKSFEAQYEKAQALIKLSKYASALNAYKRALALKPDHAHSWYGKGWCLSELGLKKEALAAFDRAFEIHPPMMLDYGLEKARILSELGREDEAHKLRKALKHAIHPPSSRWRRFPAVAILVGLLLVAIYKVIGWIF